MYIFYDINRKIKQLKKSKAYINRRGTVVSECKTPDLGKLMKSLTSSGKSKKNMGRIAYNGKSLRKFNVDLKKADAEQIRS